MDFNWNVFEFLLIDFAHFENSRVPIKKPKNFAFFFFRTQLNGKPTKKCWYQQSPTGWKSPFSRKFNEKKNLKQYWNAWAGDKLIIHPKPKIAPLFKTKMMFSFTQGEFMFFCCETAISFESVQREQHREKLIVKRVTLISTTAQTSPTTPCKTQILH